MMSKVDFLDRILDLSSKLGTLQFKKKKSLNNKNGYISRFIEIKKGIWIPKQIEQSFLKIIKPNISNTYAYIVSTVST